MANSASTRSSRSAPTPTAAAQRSRPPESRVALGNSWRFWMSFTVIRPTQGPVGVDQRQLLDAMLLQHGLGLLERGAHRRR